MKTPSATRFFTVATALLWCSLAHSQTLNGQQRTHGINAPGTTIGPSPGEGTPDPRFGTSHRDDNDINAKSPSAGAGAGQAADSGAGASSDNAPSDNAPSDNAPRSEVSGTAQADNQKTGGIWPFAIPIALIVVGVPLAGMFWMRRSKTKR